MSTSKYAWQPYEPPRAMPKDGRELSRDDGDMNSLERPPDKVNSSTGTENTHVEPEATDGCTDAAALLVLIYLLFLSTLLVGAIIMGFVVVIQYGLVVFVAVCAVVFAMVIVAATVTSIITRDAKLRKARSKIKSWHVTCKDEILKEIQNFKEDLAVYRFNNNMLLLTNYGETGSVGLAEASVTSDSTTDDGPGIKTEQANETVNKDKQSPSRSNPMASSPSPSRKKSREYRPKSLLFRAAASFTKLSMSKNASSSPSSSQRKSTKPKRSWRQRKKNSNVDDAFRYQNADVV